MKGLNTSVNKLYLQSFFLKILNKSSRKIVKIHFKLSFMRIYSPRQLIVLFVMLLILSSACTSSRKYHKMKAVPCPCEKKQSRIFVQPGSLQIFFS